VISEPDWDKFKTNVMDDPELIVNDLLHIIPKTCLISLISYRGHFRG